MDLRLFRSKRRREEKKRNIRDIKKKTHSNIIKSMAMLRGKKRAQQQQRQRQRQNRRRSRRIDLIRINR